MKKKARIFTFVCFTKLSDGIKKITLQRNPTHFYVRENKNNFFLNAILQTTIFYDLGPAKT